MTNIDLTPILQAVLALLAALITYRLVPWIKARTTAAQQDNIRAVVKVLVFAAEQLYGAGKGKEKMEYVRDKLQERGFDVDTDEIEAAVGEYLNYGQVLEQIDTVQVEAGDEEEPEAEPTEPAE